MPAMEPRGDRALTRASTSVSVSPKSMRERDDLPGGKQVPWLRVWLQRTPCVAAIAFHVVAVVAGFAERVVYDAVSNAVASSPFCRKHWGYPHSLRRYRTAHPDPCVRFRIPPKGSGIARSRTGAMDHGAPVHTARLGTAAPCRPRTCRIRNCTLHCTRRHQRDCRLRIARGGSRSPLPQSDAERTQGFGCAVLKGVAVMGPGTGRRHRRCSRRSDGWRRRSLREDCIRCCLHRRRRYMRPPRRRYGLLPRTRTAARSYLPLRRM